FINHKKPEYSLVWVIFLINMIVALTSFFAYGMDYVPVILCIVYSFVTTRVDDTILKGSKSAAKFEVITSHPDELSQDLMSKLHHGCTVIPAKGMYSNSDKSLLICVVNNLQIADFERVLAKYEDTFVVVSSVTRTYGNFKRIR
ncbi:MAG: YitT family protein, partial [Spirochaetales bacterium]|nr:YitT family protein [Spirochaetales bacterium]